MDFTSLPSNVTIVMNMGIFQWECPNKGKDSKGVYTETSEKCC